ncbi:MAG: serine hydrolase domain-containing protein [Pseudomonadota bacterium]
MRPPPMLAAALLTLPATAAQAQDLPPAGAAMAASLRAAHAAGDLPGLHAVVVLKDGALFAEAYFDGEDEAWGRPLGVTEHGPRVLHDIRSVTKSVVSLLYGIALEAGRVPPPEASLYAQFPEHADLAADPARAGIRIEHALSMSMGLEWNEDLPYSDPRNSEIAMEFSPDRYRYALEQPVVHAPGDVWTYSGGATALIGRLIERGVGKPLDVYAAETLFEPLGMDWEWLRLEGGPPSAASGLRMTPRGLARLGQLILDGGVADGRRLIPEGWFARATEPRLQTAGPLRYGLFWWLAPGEDAPAWAAGIGNGGQRLSINRDLGLVLVVLAGRYNDFEAWRLSHDISVEHLGPALERAGR